MPLRKRLLIHQRWMDRRSCHSNCRRRCDNCYGVQWLEQGSPVPWTQADRRRATSVHRDPWRWDDSARCQRDCCRRHLSRQIRWVLRNCRGRWWHWRKHSFSEDSAAAGNCAFSLQRITSLQLIDNGVHAANQPVDIRREWDNSMLHDATVWPLIGSDLAALRKSAENRCTQKTWNNITIFWTSPAAICIIINQFRLSQRLNQRTEAAPHSGVCGGANSERGLHPRQLFFCPSSFELRIIACKWKKSKTCGSIFGKILFGCVGPLVTSLL